MLLSSSAHSLVCVYRIVRIHGRMCTIVIFSFIILACGVTEQYMHKCTTYVYTYLQWDVQCTWPSVHLPVVDGGQSLSVLLFFFLLSCQGDACGRRWCWAIAHCNVMSLLVFLLLLTTALRISFTLPIKSFIGIVATREWRVASTSSHSIYSPASSSIVHMCCACANGQFIHTVRFAYTCS